MTEGRMESPTLQSCKLLGSFYQSSGTDDVLDWYCREKRHLSRLSWNFKFDETVFM